MMSTDYDVQKMAAEIASLQEKLSFETRYKEAAWAESKVLRAERDASAINVGEVVEKLFVERDALTIECGKHEYALQAIGQRLGVGTGEVVAAVDKLIGERDTQSAGYSMIAEQLEAAGVERQDAEHSLYERIVVLISERDAAVAELKAKREKLERDIEAIVAEVTATAPSGGGAVKCETCGGSRKVLDPRFGWELPCPVCGSLHRQLMAFLQGVEVGAKSIREQIEASGDAPSVCTGEPIASCTECGEPYPHSELEAGHVLCLACREQGPPPFGSEPVYMKYESEFPPLPPGDAEKPKESNDMPSSANTEPPGMAHGYPKVPPAPPAAVAGDRYGEIAKRCFLESTPQCQCQDCIDSYGEVIAAILREEIGPAMEAAQDLSRYFRQWYEHGCNTTDVRVAAEKAATVIEKWGAGR